MALLNLLEEPKDSLTTTLILNIEKLIDYAHCCNTKMHLNTFLHWKMNIANVFKHNKRKYHHQLNSPEKNKGSPNNTKSIKNLSIHNSLSCMLNVTVSEIQRKNIYPFLWLDLPTVKYIGPYELVWLE